MTQPKVRTATRSAIVKAPLSRRRHRGAGTALGIAAAVGCAGCANYHLRGPSEDPATIQYSKPVTMHAFFWGLVQDPEVHTVKDERGLESERGMGDVIVRDNLAYDIISVITLGIWKPITVQYRLKLPSDAPTVIIPGPEPADQPSNPTR